MAAALVLASGGQLWLCRTAFPGINGKIVFSSDRDYDLFIMDPDGSKVQQLTNNPDEDTFPDWQPVR